MNEAISINDDKLSLRAKAWKICIGMANRTVGELLINKVVVSIQLWPEVAVNDDSMSPTDLSMLQMCQP
jgi:hypothetical protein